MTAFTPLRALGWCAPVPAPPPIPSLDPLELSLRGRLLGVWRPGADLALTREPSGLTVRVFLPDPQQTERTHSAREAQALRDALAAALRAERCLVRYTDAFWCELGRKGWSVVAKARANPHAPQPASCFGQA